jgi:hypothetical protein
MAVAINPLSGFLLVLCASGKLLIMQANGVLVTSMSAAKSKFTSVSANAQHVLVGTQNGTNESFFREITISIS